VNLKGEPAHVGRHCGSNLYAVSPELVAFYADALDDPTARDAQIAPPLLFHSECYRFLREWYLANLFGNLHARQEWELFAPIQVGSQVRSRSTIVARYSKRGRDYVVNETDLMDAGSGQLLVRGRTHQSFLPAERPAAQGGFVVDKESAQAKQARQPFPAARGPLLASLTKQVDARRCWMFSGPGRSYHTDREAARKLGFPDIVVQGMMSTCFVSQAMREAFGAGWLTGGRMDVRLTNVLWVDEAVSVHARLLEETPEGPAWRCQCDVWVEKAEGTRVLLGQASALRSEPFERGASALTTA
jgi:acyl dehydratase